VVDVYRAAIGLDVLSPCEVASGCDVVAMRRRWPDLVLKGGIDKRVLATTPAQIDAMLERILPTMRIHGGYIPTCDHGVPEEVSLANYRHYRRRARELGVDDQPAPPPRRKSLGQNPVPRRKKRPK
jgi:uroporphyrinogen decarboxylase